MKENQVQPSRSWKRGLANIGKWVLRILGLLLVAGLAYQFVMAKMDEARYQPPGQLVSVQNTRLHVYCMGSGSPIVLLEAAEGDIGVQFQPLMIEIAKFARVCTYDRSGTGWSDPTSGLQTAEESATLFHAALQILGENGPYVVAGHSIGGVYTQAFAKLYRSEVVGMVLIDSVSQDMVLRMPPELFAGQRQALTLLRICQVATPFGLPRLIGLGKVTESSGLSEETRLIVESTVYKYPACSGLVKALQSAEQMSSISSPKPDFDDLPLIVLIRDENVIYAKPPKGLSMDLVREGEQIWKQLQEEHAHMSTRGELVVAEGSGHYIYLARPDLVLESLQRVIVMVVRK